MRELGQHRTATSRTSHGRQQANTWPYARHAAFVDTVRTAAAKWFAEHGFAADARYGYILASRSQWPNNIIDARVPESVRRERARRQAAKLGFPLHKWIHHGLSSQALLLNLVGPLVVEQDLDPLGEAFAVEGLPWPQGPVTAEWEHEDRSVFNEDYGQPTSIDLVIHNAAAEPRVFLEAKFVEQEFGGCSVFANGDCDGRNPAGDFGLCYLHHVGRRYWTLLQQHGFLEGPLRTDSTCILACHYQFFRELLFAVEKGGTFVLLSDERSPTFHCQGPQGERGLMPFLADLVPQRLRPRVGSISVQHVVEAIERSGRHSWVGEFKQKYGLQ